LLCDVFRLSVFGIRDKSVSHLSHLLCRKLMLQSLAYDIPDSGRGNAQPCHLADRLKGSDSQFTPLLFAELPALLQQHIRHPNHVSWLHSCRESFRNGPTQSLLLFFIGYDRSGILECQCISGMNRFHRLHGSLGRYALCDSFAGLAQDRLHRQFLLPGVYDDLKRPNRETLIEAILLHLGR
jgi:hypothetical protein